MKSNMWSRLRVLTWAVLCAAGTATSCSTDDDDKTPTPEPVQLTDQIEYDGATPVDIKSAIYETGDAGLYTFYLSPTADITTMEQMEAAGDYLRVQVTNPKGKVDTANETFEISYRDISVKAATMNDVEKVSLSADLVAETSQLNLYVEVVMKSGKTLLARYENSCAEAVNPVDLLQNEYDLNGTKQAVDHAVKRIDTATGKTTYLLYRTENSAIGGPKNYELTVTLDSEAGTTVDLSDPAKVSIRCEAFANDAETRGTLTLEEQDQKLTLKIDATQGEGYLRASYTGDCPVYEGSNHLKVTADESAEAALTTLFCYSSTAASQLTFGLAEASKPEELMQGKYAVAVNLTPSQLQEGTFDVSAKDVQLRLFDYVTYRTWDNSTYEGVTGTVTTRQFASMTYVQLSVEFPEGPKVEGEWFGALTSTTENPDLTPVAPFRPHVTITKPDGTVLVDKTLANMELRVEKNYKLRGGDPQYGGATFDAYFFYFRPENSQEDNIETTSTYPQFMIASSFIPTEGVLDLAVAQDDLHWSMSYGAENTMQYIPYNENYEMYGMKTLKCPDNAKVTLTRDEASKQWSVRLEFTDYGAFNSWNPTQKGGSNNTLVIEWEGPATKYTGTKTNDLTDADY